MNLKTAYARAAKWAKQANENYAQAIANAEAAGENGGVITILKVAKAEADAAAAAKAGGK
jgi:hypothetical protein